MVHTLHSRQDKHHHNEHGDEDYLEASKDILKLAKIL